MASDSVRGAEDFLALSRRLKAAGETELRKELHKAVGAAAKPLIPKVKAAAQDKFPQRGGLANRMARKPLRAQTRTGALTAGVRIVGSKVDPRMDESGRISHPVYGRKPNVVQNVPGVAGYFSETLEKAGPEIRGDVLNVLEDFTQRITKGL